MAAVEGDGEELAELRDRGGPTGVNQADNSGQQPEVYSSGFRLVMLTVGLALSIFLAALDSTIIATAIPSITAQFGSIANITWYSSAYSITNTAFQSSWGKAYKYFPLKYTYLIAIAIFEIGNIIAGAAQSSDIVILGRVISGLGGGGIMTGSFIIIALTAKPQYRAAYMGILGVTYGFASVAGPLMGGGLVDGLSWRWCFWINLPVGLFAAGTIVIFLTNPTQSFVGTASWMEKLINMDLNGGILVTGALVCFVMTMHWGATESWKSPNVLGSLIGSILLAALFILNEHLMGSKAMVQSRLLKRRNIAINSMYIFFLAGLYFPLLYSLPIQFQSVDNETAAQSGVRLIPLVLGISIFTMVSNAALTWWRHYNPFLVLGALAGTIGVSMIYTLDARTSLATWTGFEIITAVGVGLSLQIPMIANQCEVSAEDIPAATSISLFMENIGTSLFVAASEMALTRGLVVCLKSTVPGIDYMKVVNVGVTQLRSAFSSAELPSILSAYLHGCKTSHIVSVACGSVAALLSLIGAAPSSRRELARWTGSLHLREA